MARINIRVLNIQLGNAVSKSREARRIAVRKVDERFADEKERFIDEYISHPVSQEILGENSDDNSSGLLGGYGQLFSFFGFPQYEINPVIKAAGYFEKNIKLDKRNTTVRKGKRQVNFFFKTKIPSIKDIDANNEMPSWDTGGWMSKIDDERDDEISGLAYYVTGDFPTSESGGGLQSESTLSSRVFRKTPYIVKLLREFRKRLRRVS